MTATGLRSSRISGFAEGVTFQAAQRAHGAFLNSIKNAIKIRAVTGKERAAITVGAGQHGDDTNRSLIRGELLCSRAEGLNALPTKEVSATDQNRTLSSLDLLKQTLKQVLVVSFEGVQIVLTERHE